MTELLKILLLCSIVLTGVGCSTLHTAAILGHEVVHAPISRSTKTLVDGEIGFGMTSSVEGSPFTSDATESIQYFISSDSSLKLGGDFRLLWNMIGSGYYSNTRVHDRDRGQIPVNYRDFASSGLSGQLSPSLCYDLDSSSIAISMKGIYNREFGEYLAYRGSFALQGRRKNLSPHGSTLSVYGAASGQTRLSRETSVDFGMAMGPGYTDWPYTKNIVLLQDFDIQVKYRDFWVWSAVHTMGEWLPEWLFWSFPLNYGVSVGVGMSLRGLMTP